MKVLELLTEALAVAFCLKCLYFCRAEASLNGSTIKSLNVSDFFSASKRTERNMWSGSVVKSHKDEGHSRSKRFIAFPVGSSFSTAVCMTIGVIGNPITEYLSMGLNWGIAYDLPNSTWILNHGSILGIKDKEQIASPQIKRRHRRDLYGKMETLINGMGYNGRDCVLRALCESRRYFQRSKMSMIGEMLRVIFSLPKQRIFTRELMENGDIELYDRAFRKANLLGECYEQYDCSFSLLELAFGKYSTPPDSYYTIHE